MDVTGKRSEEIAEKLKVYLREKLMPYWYDTTVDSRKGGYVLLDKSDGLPGAGNSLRRLRVFLSTRFYRSACKTIKKQLVSQSRMLLVFSLSHRLGYSDAKRDYLNAAKTGYRFLIDVMLDKKYGGFYWKSDLRGRVTSSCKCLYGQAFALYALIEYHRASGLSAPLYEALRLFEKVQEKLHDRVNSGWTEHGAADFRRLQTPNNEPLWYPWSMPGVLGLKSGNAHLHWMEALTELYEVTRDMTVGSALTEALHINKTFFFPADAGKYCEYRGADWREVKGNGYDGISYGHNIQFAWLMIHAQRVLQIPEDWGHFHSILEHALEYGFDYRQGGFYAKGFDDQPAADREKVWWVQAEALAGLSDALSHQPRADYSRALDLLLYWIFKYQILSDDGVWIWSTDEEGKPVNLTKAGDWKAAYHEVRAITKYISAFLTPHNTGIANGNRAERWL